MGATRRFAPDGLAVDDLDLTAELFRQIPPDLLGNRLRLKVRRPGHITAAAIVMVP
jgi:hypothetical protein